MKLVSYLNEGRDQLAFLVDGLLFDCDLLHPDLPNSMNMFLHYWDDMFPDCATGRSRHQNAEGSVRIPVLRLKILNCWRLFLFQHHAAMVMPFSQHVAAARRNRKVEMIPEFDQYPIFYFTNHHSIQGPGDIKCMPDHFEKLDFELEAAIVVCKQGRNITAENADQYIGGLMIMNDMSARRLQMEEMLLNLGPAKGKDFSTVIGPCLVTLDELEAYEVPCKDGHTGKSWNLGMKCSVNGIQVSDGNL
jgi:fumarylacetoacetate (FAA) hydrolase